MLARQRAVLWLLLSYVPAALLVAVAVGVCAVLGELHLLIVLGVAYVVGDLYLGAASRHEKLRFRGSPVTKTSQPELRAFIDDVMRRAGVRRLDGVWIDAGANAGALSGRRDWLGRRRLGLTIGLLTVAHLDYDELKVVLAHEAGHLRDRNRLRAHLVRRRRKASRANWWTRVAPLGAYSRWFVAQTRGFAIDAERHADATAITLCGQDAVSHALHRVAEIDALHAAVLELFLQPGYLRGIAPPRLWPAYEAIWQSPGLISEAVSRRLAAQDQDADTHPGLAERSRGRQFAIDQTLRGNVALAGFDHLDERATFRLTRAEAKLALRTVAWSDFDNTDPEPQPRAPAPAE